MRFSLVAIFGAALVASTQCGSESETPCDNCTDTGLPVDDAGQDVLPVVDPDASDPDAPSPNEDPVTPPATQDELIRAFAPHLHLNPDDTNRPSSVDWYLARVRMRFHHNNCVDHELLPLGSVTQATLVSQEHADNKSLCRHDDALVRKSTNSENFFLEVMDTSTYLGSPRSDWRTYVTWDRPGGTGAATISYWFFYPFNDNTSVIDHESDWEHVRVVIIPEKGAKEEALESIYFSQHHGGQSLDAKDPRVQWQGTHPVVYSAKGTHANFPIVGTFDIAGTAGIAKDVTKAAAPGDVWETEKQAVLIGTRAAPKNGQVFVKYWGRWGELRDLPETNGILRHFP